MNMVAIPGATPKTTKLKIDSRGRVRFSAQGCRFEVTKRGLNVYDRSRYFGQVEEVPASFFNVNRLTNETLKLLAEAVNLVNA